jgi:hypothetical protein
MGEDASWFFQETFAAQREREEREPHPIQEGDKRDSIFSFFTSKGSKQRLDEDGRPLSPVSSPSSSSRNGKEKSEDAEAEK